MSMNTLKCPLCHWDGSEDGEHDSWFRLCEDATIEHRVEGFNAAGALEISSEEQTVTDESSRRLRWGNCLHEFAQDNSFELTFT